MSGDAAARECRVFTRYLTGGAPTAYVAEKYLEGQRRHPGFAAPARPFERLLVRLARVHPAATRIADAYARLFEPRCLLRKKLVLLLAVLESTAPYAARLEEVAAGSRALLFVRLGLHGARFALAALAGSLLLLPARAVVALGGGGRPWRR